LIPSLADVHKQTDLMQQNLNHDRQPTKHPTWVPAVYARTEQISTVPGQLGWRYMSHVQASPGTDVPTEHK
jgi:hypothetical protein